MRAKYVEKFPQDFLRINFVGVVVGGGGGGGGGNRRSDDEDAAAANRRSGGASLRKGLLNSKPPSLLYALTTHNKNASIYNVSQVAATILGASRRLFFDLKLRLDRFLNPGKIDCAYWGKS